jgi:hypothetical protein
LPDPGGAGEGSRWQRSRKGVTVAPTVRGGAVWGVPAGKAGNEIAIALLEASQFRGNGK